MMWICPICWEVFSIHKTCCPQCGSDLVTTHGDSFTAKLEQALKSPELRTVTRAADILVRRFDSNKTNGSILATVLRQRWQEPEIAAAIVRAIGRLGGRTVHNVLLGALGHESMLVRAAAASCLQSRARIAS